MKIKMHPEIQKVQEIWKQIKILKEEDRSQYKAFMLSLPNESATAKLERLPIFSQGFINLTNPLLRAKGDAIYKQGIQRDKLSDGQEVFVDSADRSKQSLEEIVQNEVSPSISAYGTVFAVMDKPRLAAENRAEELVNGIPFLTILDPLQVISFRYSDDGALEWFAYWVDAPVVDADPWNPKTDPIWKGEKKGIAFWTRNDFSIRTSGGNSFIVPITPHSFGIVPVIIQAQYVEPNQTIGAATFFSTSDYILMGNALENAANMEVFKNANSTLAMDIQDWDSELEIKHEKSADTNLKVLNKQAHDFKNVFLYQKSAPEYITKDLALIEKASDRAKKYFLLAVENERRLLTPETLQSPQSGVSKGYDFAEANGMLASLASALERFEIQAVSLAGILMDSESDDFIIQYPNDFDIRTFSQRLEFVKGLLEIRFPSDIGIKTGYKSLTPEITRDEKTSQEINDEIDALKASETITQKEGTNGNPQ